MHGQSQPDGRGSIGGLHRSVCPVNRAWVISRTEKAKEKMLHTHREVVTTKHGDFKVERFLGRAQHARSLSKSITPPIDDSDSLPSAAFAFLFSNGDSILEIDISRWSGPLTHPFLGPTWKPEPGTVLDTAADRPIYWNPYM